MTGTTPTPTRSIGAIPAPSLRPASHPANPPPTEPAKDLVEVQAEHDGADIDRFLTEERQKLIDRGVLDPEEVALGSGPRKTSTARSCGPITSAARSRPKAARSARSMRAHRRRRPMSRSPKRQWPASSVGPPSWKEAGLSADTRVQVVAAYNVSMAVNSRSPTLKGNVISATSIILVLLIGFRGSSESSRSCSCRCSSR